MDGECKIEVADAVLASPGAALAPDVLLAFSPRDYICRIVKLGGIVRTLDPGAGLSHGVIAP
jgi:hypothetical protein